MGTVGAFEAKTHLSALLDRVALGERITITRHGKPAAILAPADAEPQRMSQALVLQAFRELRQGVRPDSITVAQMVREGRK